VAALLGSIAASAAGGRSLAPLPWTVVSPLPPRPPRAAPVVEPVPLAVQETVRQLVDVSPVLGRLGERFTAAGFQAHLVGGSVRDALLAAAADGPAVPGDLDVTTDARPEQVLELMRGFASSTWNTGIAFGTIGAEVSGVRLEITTFRADRYDRESRNPEVAWGDSLVDDLARRDFTVNAMAVSLGPDRTVTDPFGGLGDLMRRELRTPSAATESFADDPLRMLRAVRFVAQLGLTPADDVVEAMTAMSGELARITPERVQAELSKTLLQDAPRAALELFVSTGLADVVLPELSALRMEIDEHHQHKDVYTHSLTVLDRAIALEKADADAESPDLVLRLAALLHDVGKPATRRHEPRGRVSFHHHEVVGAKLVRKRLTALRYPKDVVEDVARLTFLHLRFHGYGRGEWTDSAVRRYVTDAGDLLPRLHKLVRSDCTTRNRRRAAALAATYDSLEQRIAELSAAEDLARVRPDLDGNAIMSLLGIPPGPEVGEAWRFLKELRLERGPLDPAEAEEELRRWWAARQP
jgi:poly(A) polymerase